MNVQYVTLNVVSFHLKCGEDVWQGLAVCVMAVNRKNTGRHLLHDTLQHFTHGTWSAHAIGVPQGDLVASHLIQSLGYLRRGGKR